VRRVADAVLWLTIAILVAAIAWLPLHPAGGILDLLRGNEFFDVVLVAASVALAWLGRLIVRRSANRIGLAFLGVALGTALLGGTDIPLSSATAPYPGWLTLLAFGTVIGRTLVIVSLSIVLLLFPSGALPSPRWRWVGWLWLAGTIGLGVGALMGPFDGAPAGLTNPIYVEALTPLINILLAGAFALVFVVGAGIVSLVIKARQGNAETKALVKLLLLVAGVASVGFALAATATQGSIAGTLGFAIFLFALMVGIPTALIIPVLKYRLYDIDLVIRKTVVFGLLAVFITGVYAAIVGMVSLRFGDSQVGSFLAAIALAVLFAPARDRARKIADRFVYGRRATPYEVLAEFSDRVGGAYAADDVLHRMAQVLEEGTGASGARVLLRVGTERREAASIGEQGEETVVEVTHQGEELGALAVSMPAADPMNPAKLQLVEDLAAQAGLVLRNVKLIEELKASRQRLVAAQDEERRKIERNIHDGAQQQLVALAVQLRLAGSMVGKDPDKERELLVALAERTNEALEDLRDLARGIYPPLLQDKGLPAALETQARKAVVPTTVEADGIGRFDRATESAVYFSCLEAMQNIAKYAEASRAEITLARGEDRLMFTVTDDGRGFDPARDGYGTGLQGIADRLAVLDGRLRVESSPNRGTLLFGEVPV
jgi:signal transduction histidine kinase